MRQLEILRKGVAELCCCKVLQLLREWMEKWKSKRNHVKSERVTWSPRERLHVHDSSKGLYLWAPTCLLLAFFGGNVKSFETLK